MIFHSCSWKDSSFSETATARQLQSDIDTSDQKHQARLEDAGATDSEKYLSSTQLSDNQYENRGHGEEGKDCEEFGSIIGISEETDGNNVTATNQDEREQVNGSGLSGSYGGPMAYPEGNLDVGLKNYNVINTFVIINHICSSDSLNYKKKCFECYNVDYRGFVQIMHAFGNDSHEKILVFICFRSSIVLSRSTI